MKRLTPERELDIMMMAKRPSYSCDVLIALETRLAAEVPCKVWQALRELWEDREILKQQLNDERN